MQGTRLDASSVPQGLYFSQELLRLVIGEIRTQIAKGLPSETSKPGHEEAIVRNILIDLFEHFGYVNPRIALLRNLSFGGGFGVVGTDTWQWR